MEIDQVRNKSGLLNEGTIITDLIDKQPFGSREQELIVKFLMTLQEINPELAKKLLNC